MGILSWIILGLIAGFIASKIVNKTGSGMTMDIALGVIGQAQIPGDGKRLRRECLVQFDHANVRQRHSRER